MNTDETEAQSTVDLRPGSPVVESVGAIDAARASSITADIRLRAIMVLVVSAIFVWLNWQIVELVKEALVHDRLMMSGKAPIPAADRLITSNVVMALIGATVVQTGAGFIAITSYLFPKRSSAEG